MKEMLRRLKGDDAPGTDETPIERTPDRYEIVEQDLLMREVYLKGIRIGSIRWRGWQALNRNGKGRPYAWLITDKWEAGHYFFVPLEGGEGRELNDGDPDELARMIAEEWTDQDWESAFAESGDGE